MRRQTPLRPNLLLSICLGAAWLPISAGWAAPADAPAPVVTPLPAQNAIPSPTAPAVPLPRVETALDASGTDAQPSPVRARPVAQPAKALHRPTVPHPKAAARPVVHRKPLPVQPARQPVKVLAAPINSQVPAWARPAAPRAQAPPVPVAQAVPVPMRPAAAVHKPVPQPPAAVRALPDYGGRDGIAGTAYAAQSSPALNPLTQAWRAFEALAIVLALVVGGLYGLKRSGILKADGSISAQMPVLAGLPGFLKAGKPMKSPPPAPLPLGTTQVTWITMIGSQALPNTPDASLHLVTLAGKTLLLGATAQSVSLITELDADWQADPAPTMDTGQMPSSFDGFLTQADQSPLRQSNETELLMNATTMRLQAMIARSEGQSNGHRS